MYGLSQTEIDDVELPKQGLVNKEGRPVMTIQQIVSAEKTMKTVDLIDECYNLLDFCHDRLVILDQQDKLKSASKKICKTNTI